MTTNRHRAAAGKPGPDDRKQEFTRLWRRQRRPELPPTGERVTRLPLSWLGYHPHPTSPIKGEEDSWQDREERGGGRGEFVVGKGGEERV
jgi:hypothetical protein